MENLLADGGEISVRSYKQIHSGLYECKIRHNELPKKLSGTYTIQALSKKFNIKSMTTDTSKIIEQIKEHVEKNQGQWDLTNDDGNPIVFCYKKNVHIPDLAINKDGKVCALVPLSQFSEEALLNILEMI